MATFRLSCCGLLAFALALSSFGCIVRRTDSEAKEWNTAPVEGDPAKFDTAQFKSLKPVVIFYVNGPATMTGSDLDENSSPLGEMSDLGARHYMYRKIVGSDEQAEKGSPFPAGQRSDVEWEYLKKVLGSATFEDFFFSEAILRSVEWVQFNCGSKFSDSGLSFVYVANNRAPGDGIDLPGWRSCAAPGAGVGGDMSKSRPGAGSIELDGIADANEFPFKGQWLSHPDVFKRTLEQIAKVFPPEKHRFILVTKSHGSKDLALGVRINLDVKRFTPESLRKLLVDKADASGALSPGSSWYVAEKLAHVLKGTLTTKPDGTLVVKPSGALPIKPDGTLDALKPDGTLTVKADGVLEVKADGTLALKPDGTLELKPDGTLEIKPDGTLGVKADGTLEAKPHGTLDVKADGTLAAKSDGVLELKEDGTLGAGTHLMTVAFEIGRAHV